MMSSRKTQAFRNTAREHAAPIATLICVFATGIAVSCFQSGLGEFALIPAGISVVIAASGLLSRVPQLALIPVRVTRRKQ